MAYDKIVDGVQLDANLTSIANAIREKNSTSAQIPFPAGFVTAINALETGGALTINATNLHDTATDVADVYIQYGEEEEYIGWSATDYIPVAANTIYAFSISATAPVVIKGSYCAKYSENKKYTDGFLGGISTLPGSFMLWENGTEGYIRLSGINSAMEVLKVYSCTGALNVIPSM